MVLRRKPPRLFIFGLLLPGSLKKPWGRREASFAVSRRGSGVRFPLGAAFQMNQRVGSATLVTISVCVLRRIGSPSTGPHLLRQRTYWRNGNMWRAVRSQQSRKSWTLLVVHQVPGFAVGSFAMFRSMFCLILLWGG